MLLVLVSWRQTPFTRTLTQPQRGRRPAAALTADLSGCLPSLFLGGTSSEEWQDTSRPLDLPHASRRFTQPNVRVCPTTRRSCVPTLQVNGSPRQPKSPCQQGHGWARGKLDLTVPGSLLQMAVPLERGQAVQLVIYLDVLRPMRSTLGLVRWVSGKTAGIEFIRMSTGDQERLRVVVGFKPQFRVSSSWGETPLCAGY
ncbi:MAG: hypothetical protein LZF62_480220 [Nitrospira sp.]|nr:MAG: hypothetical protein LZF62_480220 [Nitrospira sp.]